jgi:putative ABC transport system ATP-binding protein
VITLRSVTRSFPGRGEVLRGVDLEVGAGELTAVVGRSGTGKTTLLNIIGGLDEGFGGDVEVAGRSLRGLGDRALSRLRCSTIGFVFQAYHLLDHLSVLENVTLPFLFARRDVDDRGAVRRATRALEAVGMGGRGGDRPARLSGGERQRVAVARALVAGPSILLCDEPTGNLDPHTGSEIVALLQTVNETEGTTVLVATHDESISRCAGRVLELRRGVLDDWGGPAGAVS